MKGGDCGDVGSDNADISYQWHDPEGGNSEDMEYGPQTYFSFAELLASEDGELDDQYDCAPAVLMNLEVIISAVH